MAKENRGELPLIMALDKPQEMTSFDAVAIVRRSLGIKKVGHLGTLDPMASGLLLIGINGASRIMDYLEGSIKEYRGKGRLGVVTDTLDIWGKELTDSALSRNPTTVTKDELEEEMRKLEGQIDQVPPIYSALKLDGKKLYEYAREGKAVDLESKTRKVFVERFRLLDFDGKDYSFVARVGSGTYIRSLVSDVGIGLGTGSIMTELRRTEIDGVTLEKAVPVEEIKTMERKEILERCFSPDLLLGSYGAIDLKGSWEEKLFCSGVIMRDDQFNIRVEGQELFRVYGKDGDFLGMGRILDGQLKAHKVFNRWK